MFTFYDKQLYSTFGNKAPFIKGLSVVTNGFINSW